MWYRNRLTQILLDQEETNRLINNENKDFWYSVNFNYLDSEISATFYLFYFDDDAETFLTNSNIISNNLCLQIYYSICSMFLSLLMTKTSINGLLNRGRMHLFSRNQFKNFIGLSDDWSNINKNILDIGAGDGEITKIFSEFYSNVFVVEASKVMEWRLSQKGFKVLSLKKWKNSGPYHLITALNLIDRHYNPIELLSDLQKLAIESNCLVMISLVLPYNSYVEFNLFKKGQTKPLSFLNTNGYKFEDYVNTLVRNTFNPAGFELIRWTKLPYLCEGDLSQTYYKLDDVIFLLRPIARIQNALPNFTTSNNLQNVKNEL